MALVFELIDVLIMAAIVGYLFRDAFQRRPRKGDVLDYYQHIKGAGWRDFFYAIALIAPTIILHELAHKLVAMGFGLSATFHAACSSADLVTGTLFNGICMIQIAALVMKAMGIGFVIFVPAFVAISGSALPWQSALISVAGPLVHLAAWIGAKWYISAVRRIPAHRRMFLMFFERINMFLFILNMLPIPGFDGLKFYLSLWQTVF